MHASFSLSLLSLSLSLSLLYLCICRSYLDKTKTKIHTVNTVRQLEKTDPTTHITCMQHIYRFCLYPFRPKARLSHAYVHKTGLGR